MKRSLLALGAIVVAAGLASCDAKNESKPAVVSSYKTHTDDIARFSVSYPDGWMISTTPGSRALFYSDANVAEAFSTFEPAGRRGAKIEVNAKQGDASLVPTMIAELREVFTEPGAVKEPEQTTVNGLPATKVSYGALLEEDGQFTAERYFIVADGYVTYLETAVIGAYADYKTIFDEVRKSFQPARVAAASATPDTATGATTTPAEPRDSIVTDPPAAEMKTFSGSTFSMAYPANFDATSSGDGAIFSGARADSRVQVNVYPNEEGVALEKIVESSKKNYGGRSATPASVGGQKAFVFPFGSGSATGRAYFITAGKRLFVISTTWYSAQGDLYQPAYQKMIASFKPKG
jgi:hypothetical protein